MALNELFQNLGISQLLQYSEASRAVFDPLYVVFTKLFYLSLFVLGGISLIYLLIMVYIMLNKREPYRESAVRENELPFVTVQIPTRNELAALRCAEKCLEFDYPKNKYEILIGDDSDKPEVSAKLAAFAARHPLVKVIKRKTNAGYKAGNLNNLLRHSRGEFLVLFDSDFVPSKDFLRRIIAPMLHDKGIAAVQARWKFLNPGQNIISVLGSSIVGVVHHVALPFFNKRRGLSFLCGSAEAVRKEVLEKLGGWQHGSLTEDIEYSFRLLKNGYRIQYLPALECYSEVPFTSKDLYRQQTRWAYGVIASLKAHASTLFTSKKLSLEDKLLISYQSSGYLLSTTLLAVMLFGVLSILTHKPEPIDFGRFFFETGRNIIFTSGLLATAAYSLAKIGQAKKILPMLASALTYGIIVTLHVNSGIFRALRGKPMQWFLLQKHGNKQAN